MAKRFVAVRFAVGAPVLLLPLAPVRLRAALVLPSLAPSVVALPRVANRLLVLSGLAWFGLWLRVLLLVVLLLPMAVVLERELLIVVLVRAVVFGADPEVDSVVAGLAAEDKGWLPAGLAPVDDGVVEAPGVAPILDVEVAG